MLDTMIYNPDASTILEGFGVSEETKKELVETYLSGSRAEILSKICNNSMMPQAHRYLLLVEFGTRLVFDEISIRQEELERFNANKTSTGEGSTDLS